MDIDTEQRSIAPIAVRSQEGDFVDILSGPQNGVGCDANIGCEKRISTFWAVVAAGKINSFSILT